MSYIIRKTKGGDIECLADVERSAGRAFKSIADLSWIADDIVMSVYEHERIIAFGLSWVAYESVSKAITGFITAEIFQDECYVSEISVSEAHQRKGIGSKLIQAALKEAMALDLKAATLTTFIDVPWNAPYYERLGFVILKGDTVPSYLMKKLQDEGRAGLPLERRCAMRKMF